MGKKLRIGIVINNNNAQHTPQSMTKTNSGYSNISAVRTFYSYGSSYIVRLS